MKTTSVLLTLLILFTSNTHARAELNRKQENKIEVLQACEEFQPNSIKFTEIAREWSMFFPAGKHRSVGLKQSDDGTIITVICGFPGHGEHTLSVTDVTVNQKTFDITIDWEDASPRAAEKHKKELQAIAVYQTTVLAKVDIPETPEIRVIWRGEDEAISTITPLLNKLDVTFSGETTAEDAKNIIKTLRQADSLNWVCTDDYIESHAPIRSIQHDAHRKGPPWSVSVRIPENMSLDQAIDTLTQVDGIEKASVIYINETNPYATLRLLFKAGTRYDQAPRIIRRVEGAQLSELAKHRVSNNSAHDISFYFDIFLPDGASYREAILRYESMPEIDNAEFYIEFDEREKKYRDSKRRVQVNDDDE